LIVYSLPLRPECTPLGRFPLHDGPVESKFCFLIAVAQDCGSQQVWLTFQTPKKNSD
jgi:hypothetical protein